MRCLELAVSSRLLLKLIHAFDKHWLFATILFSPGWKFPKKKKKGLILMMGPIWTDLQPVTSTAGEEQLI